MSEPVVSGATIQCSCGNMQTRLVVPPLGREIVDGHPIATVLDNTPANISPFGLCSSPTNAMVIAATACADGAPTPQPCVPFLPAPWSPGQGEVLSNGAQSLSPWSTCFCAWGGTVSIMTCA